MKQKKPTGSKILFYIVKFLNGNLYFHILKMI